MLCAPKLDPDVPTVAAENRFAALFAGRPVILAPMEEVTDALFRRICRRLGAELCVTEFVNVEGLLRGCKKAARKVGLGPGDQPTAIQIYGADVGRLIEAARVAEQAAPAFIDINCGCWVPKIARRGAGSGWLRAPDAMVEMVAAVVRQESEFDPRAVSAANAYGLTQILPSTGRDLSRRLRVRGFNQKMLLRPEFNLRLGTQYLKSLLAEFDGRWEPALAAYNAGKSRVVEWQQRTGYREPAEFVEAIPFSETRNYVQVVLRNADLYRRLYRN